MTINHSGVLNGPLLVDITSISLAVNNATISRKNDNKHRVSINVSRVGYLIIASADVKGADLR